MDSDGNTGRQDSGRQGDPRRQWVCLGGGNALGAFHGGVIQGFVEAGVVPERVAGTSIGAVSAALWLGGEASSAPDRLRAFWAASADQLAPGSSKMLRQNAVQRSMVYGRPGLFRPSFPGFLAIHYGAPPDDHLFDPDRQRRLLQELVDFDRLNAGPTRLIVVAHDQTTGEDVVFDTRDRPIGVDHLMASAAMPLLFPPVVVDGRPLVDAGLSSNMPVDYLLADAPSADTLCWAVDLWPRTGARAATPDAVLRRSQDLVFAAQRRNSMDRAARLAREHRETSGFAIALRELVHDGGDWEIGGKALDFTAASLQRRWTAGLDALQQAKDEVRIG